MPNETRREIWAVWQDVDASRPCLEAVGAGTELARHLQLELAVCTLDSTPEHLIDRLRGLAARVYLIRRPAPKSDGLEAFTAMLDAAVGRCGPATLVFPPTRDGADLAARMAARHRKMLFSSCLKFTRPGGEGLVCQKLIYGGKATAHLRVADDDLPYFTVVSGVFEAPKARAAAEITIEELEMPSSLATAAKNPRVVDVKRGDPGRVDISEAERLVCGGGGVVDADGHGFQLLNELAHCLEAGMAGSRALRDAGKIELDRQIGQTGKTVSPQILISCGVSGSKYHTVGMRDAEVVIAINNDPHAAIFKLADLGVVGDAYEVLPRLIERLKSNSHR